MARNPFRRTGAAEHAVEPPDDGESRRVGRRALLTGGAMVAGVVGAGAALTAAAAPASAATGSALLQGAKNTASSVNDPATEIAATSTSAPTPTLVLTNTGSPATSKASPPLRITPAAPGLYEPSDATVGGDMLATNDGNLWFTHNNPGDQPVKATVHTDATANSFVPLTAPYRILDTRNSAGRANVLNASGNLDSQGRLLAGHTIHIDLSALVWNGDAVTSNLTIIGPLAGGWALVWPGSGTRPNSSSIAFAKGQAIANLTVCGIDHSYSSSSKVTDTIAITSAQTTHVILDVAGFYVGNIGWVISHNPFAASSSASASATKAAAAVHASQARAALNS